MANKYQKQFHIFKSMDNDFGNPSGYIKVEINGEQAKLQLSLNNLLDRQGASYQLYGINKCGNELKYTKISDIPYNNARADIKVNTATINVGSNSLLLESINVYAVIAYFNSKTKTKCPLVAYTKGDISWKNEFDNCILSIDNKKVDNSSLNFDRKNSSLQENIEAKIKDRIQQDNTLKNDITSSQEKGVNAISSQDTVVESVQYRDIFAIREANRILQENRENINDLKCQNRDNFNELSNKNDNTYLSLECDTEEKRTNNDNRETVSNNTSTIDEQNERTNECKNVSLNEKNEAESIQHRDNISENNVAEILIDNNTSNIDNKEIEDKNECKNRSLNEEQDEEQDEERNQEQNEKRNEEQNQQQNEGQNDSTRMFDRKANLQPPDELLSDIRFNSSGKFESIITSIYNGDRASSVTSKYNDAVASAPEEKSKPELSFEDNDILGSVEKSFNDISSLEFDTTKNRAELNIANLREELDKSFESYNPFKMRSKNFIWWKINSPGYLNNILFRNNVKTYLLFNPKVMLAHYKYRYIIFGIRLDRRSGKEYFICGIPGVYRIDENPFGNMGSWAQTEGYKPKYGAFGYWTIMIDPKTGKLIKLR